MFDERTYDYVQRFRKGAFFIVLVGAAIAALGGMMFSTAQQQSSVGYVDRDAIVDLYAGLQISMVMNERDRLQDLFDQESEGLDAEAKQALFERYETLLKEFEENVGIRNLMEDLTRAFEEVAAESGVDVILDVSAVVYGGVDLTPRVAERLGL